MSAQEANFLPYLGIKPWTPGPRPGFFTTCLLTRQRYVPNVNNPRFLWRIRENHILGMTEVVTFGYYPDGEFFINAMGNYPLFPCFIDSCF